MLHPHVKIVPASNGIGRCYAVDTQGRWHQFAYVWAVRVGSAAWFSELAFAVKR